MSEENKRVAARFFELFQQGAAAHVGEVVDPDFQHHNWPWASPGVAGLNELIAMVESGFTDYQFQIEDTITEGDKVVVRMSQSAVHSGELMGVPPTGKQVNYTGIHILRIANGKVVEHWREEDIVSLMQQLGAIPG